MKKPTDILIRAFSAERLASYHRKGECEIEYLSRYLWNVALCESLYPSLQCLEVTLRNSINISVSQEMNNPYWFDDATLIGLNELESVSNAKNLLTRKRKPVEHNRIIAELNFGFWTALFDSRYEQKIWPKHLKSVFPNMPRALRSRHIISKRLNRIRYLRNRVFHHEPIWHWLDLGQQHDEIMETIGWLSPIAGDLTIIVDRFHKVHTDGWQSNIEAVKTIIAQYLPGGER